MAYPDLIRFRNVYDHGSMYCFDAEYERESQSYLIKWKDSSGHIISIEHSHRTPPIDSMKSLETVCLQTVKSMIEDD